MHYTHIVALPGHVASDKLSDALEEAMSKFDENLEVPLHRDTSAYAEPFADELAKAKISNRDNWTAGLTDAEIVEQWNGASNHDIDGWPMTASNPNGHWDWWVIGGRWGGAWHLRDNAENGPLSTGNHAFGREQRADAPDRTDNARWRDIIPESITPTYSWLDLAGQWHTQWVGPTHEEAIETGMRADTSHWEVPESEHAAKFMTFLVNLPGDTWLIHIDYHS